MQNLSVLCENDLKVSFAFSNTRLKWTKAIEISYLSDSEKLLHKKTGSLRKLCRLQGISGGNQWQTQGHFHALGCPPALSMHLLAFLDPSMSKLNATWLEFQIQISQISVCTREPGRHLNLVYLIQYSQGPCEVDDIVTLTLQKRKPEFREVQSRAKVCVLSVKGRSSHYGTQRGGVLASHQKVQV